MESTIPCITCRRNMRDTGKITEDGYFAYCTICEAQYQIVPLVNEQGAQMYTADGAQAFYLNPVHPGKAEFLPKEEVREEPKPDFSELLKKIQNAKTPNDLA